jgi:hypothetical protein
LGFVMPSINEGIDMQADYWSNLPWVSRDTLERAIVHIDIAGHPRTPAIEQAFHVRRHQRGHDLVDRCALLADCNRNSACWRLHSCLRRRLKQIRSLQGGRR